MAIKKNNLKNIFRNYLEVGALFTKYKEIYGLPFECDDTITLDIDFLSKYGERLPSPLIEDYQDNIDYVLVNGEYVIANGERLMYFENGMHIRTLGELIVKILHQRYDIQWKKLWESMEVEYNPIHNYNMSESENVKSKIEVSSENSNSIYGFNSSNAVPQGKSDGSVVTEGASDNNERSLTRSGNIGVTTSQKMLSDEREVWKYDYLEVVFKQVAKMITSPVYDRSML